METKAFEAFTKSIEGRAVTGIAAVFGNIDSYGDIVHKGAFKKTIVEQAPRVRHLWMHDFMTPPTAVIKDMKEVGRGELPDEVKEKFPEAKGGLEVTREYLDTPRGSEILAGIQAGAIKEMSFGYEPVKFDFETLKDAEGKNETLVRNLREVKLYDISDVNWGANPATAASKAEDEVRRLIEVVKGRFDGFEGRVTDPPLQGGNKEGRVLSARNVGRLRDALATLEEILLAAEPLEDEESLKALTEQVLRKLEIAERNVWFAGRS